MNYYQNIISYHIIIRMERCSHLMPTFITTHRTFYDYIKLPADDQQHFHLAILLVSQDHFRVCALVDLMTS